MEGKTNKILESALKYLEHNISFVPVKRDKIPLIKWEEFQNRRPTKEEVVGWWKRWPDANLAIITGKISGVTIVDVEKGGDISKFPLTTTIKSGGGGWHLYYQYHPIKTANRVLPLTDVKSDGGMCTAPPSIHASGDEYKVLRRMNYSPFPAELFNEERIKTSKDLDHLLNEAIPEGERNNTATSICGKLLLRFKESEWESQAWPLFKSWNITHNNPPLKDSELLSIFNSISQSESRRQSSGASVGEPVLLEQADKFVISVPITDGFAVFEFADVEYSSKSIETITRCSVEMPGTVPRGFVQRINILSSSAKESFARQLRDAFPGGKAKIGWPLIFSQACELLEKTLKKQSEEEEYDETLEADTSYLLRPFIEENVPNIIFGMGGSGKTYLSLRMAISIALGEPFLGITPDKQANTLFVDYENTLNIWSSRITKLLKGMNVEEKSIVKSNLFYFNTKGIPLHDIKYQLLETMRKRNIGLVIVDSAALACGGEPESAEIANRLFNALNRLNTTILLIAHETKNTDSKNKTPFGSIFFYNCARNIWNVENSQEQEESVIHVGLFHRKSNNDRLSSVRSARIYFGDGMVDINPEEASKWTKELTLKSRILSELKDGVNKIEDICTNIKKDRGQVRARLNELKNKGLVDSPSNGFWELNTTPNSTPI